LVGFKIGGRLTNGADPEQMETKEDAKACGGGRKHGWSGSQLRKFSRTKITSVVDVGSMLDPTNKINK
jgi:hypothetical protein